MVQTYQTFRRSNSVELGNFLQIARKCGLKVILSMQLHNQQFFSNRQNIDKLRIIQKYRNTAISQIADEPRSKKQDNNLAYICSLLKGYNIESHVQEGVRNGNYGCVTSYGIHSYRRFNAPNPSIRRMTKSIRQTRKNNYKSLALIRMFNDKSTYNWGTYSKMTLEDARRELCVILKKSNPTAIGFFTYNKIQSGEGMMQNQNLYQMAVKLISTTKQGSICRPV